VKPSEIGQTKKTKVYLISHERSCTGAPLFLQNLYFFLQNHSLEAEIFSHSANGHLDIPVTTYTDFVQHVLEDCVDWEDFKIRHAQDLKKSEKKIILGRSFNAK